MTKKKKKMIRNRNPDYFLTQYKKGNDLLQTIQIPTIQQNSYSFLWRLLDTWVIVILVFSVYLLYIYSPILENIKHSKELLAEPSCYMNTPAKMVGSCAEAKRIFEMSYAEHVSEHIRTTINTLSSRLLGEGIVSVIFFLVVIVVIILSYTFIYAVKTYTNMELTRTLILYAGQSIRQRWRK